MGITENKEIVHRIYDEAINRGDLSVLDQYVDAKWAYTGPLTGIGQGPDGLKKLVAMSRAGLPDVHVVIEETVAEDDKVFEQISVTGTHLGHFAGVPPTEKKLSLRMAELWRLANGKVIEFRPFPNQLETMQQLGFTLLPPQE